MRRLLYAALCGAFIFAPQVVNASTLYSFTTQASTTVANALTGSPVIFLFSTSTGQYPDAPPKWYLDNLDIVLENTSGSRDVTVRLVRYTSLSPTTYETVATSSTETVTTKGVYNFTFAAPVDLYAERGAVAVPRASSYFWYALIFDATGTTGALRPYGGSPDYTNSYYYNDGASDFNPYLVLRGTDLFSGTDTRIISLDTPLAGSITPSNSVNFSYQYYFNDTTHFDLIDRACISLTDTTNGVQLAPKCNFITGSGVNNSEYTYSNLTSGSLYSWYGYLSGSTTANRIVSPPQTFFVVFNGLIDGNASTTATSTSGTLAFFGGMLTTVWEYSPYSYITDIRTELDNMATGTAAFTIDPPEWIADNVFTPLRTGIAALLWLSLLSYIVYRVTHTEIV